MTVEMEKSDDAFFIIDIIIFSEGNRRRSTKYINVIVCLYVIHARNE